jgi:hypothetical protein
MAFVSCGSGGPSDTNGGLCEQCGDSDGPCISPAKTTGGDRPEGCTKDPCFIELRCARKVDSGQRRCFPVNPQTLQLDFFYECDGSKPEQVFVPTPTATATATPEPSKSPTPTNTGLTPSPTSVTPTSTAKTPTPTTTPQATATPELQDVDVTITIETTGADLPMTFAATVRYPAAKGNFLLDGAIDCDDDAELTPHDNGNGTVAIAFSSEDTEGTDSVSLDCVFHQTAGEPLVAADLDGSTTASGAAVKFELP